MSALARIRYWEAGGWHLHITHPDGYWERRVFRRDEWWQIDAIIREIVRTYGKTNVQVDG